MRLHFSANMHKWSILDRCPSTTSHWTLSLLWTDWSMYIPFNNRIATDSTFEFCKESAEKSCIATYYQIWISGGRCWTAVLMCYFHLVKATLHQCSLTFWTVPRSYPGLPHVGCVCKGLQPTFRLNETKLKQVMTLPSFLIVSNVCPNTQCCVQQKF